MKSPATDGEATPDIRADELRRIAAANDGILRPEDVVAAARPKTSPIHDCFTWDNTAAAREYRLWQARQLIRVTVAYADIRGKEEPFRVFVSLTPQQREKGGGYRETTAVLANPDWRRQLLQDARDELERIESKYAALTELAEVFRASKRFRDSLED